MKILKDIWFYSSQAADLYIVENIPAYSCKLKFLPLKNKKKVKIYNHKF